MLALAAATALGLTAAALWQQRPAQAGALCTGLLAGAVFFLLMAVPAWTALLPLAWLGPLAVNRAVERFLGEWLGGRVQTSVPAAITQTLDALRAAGERAMAAVPPDAR